MMPGANLFVMGGREVNLGDRQHLIFRAGANGTMVGNYLTSAGKSPEEVLSMVRAEGLEVKGPGEAAHWAFSGDAPRGDAAWNRRALEGERRAKPLRVVG